MTAIRRMLAFAAVALFAATPIFAQDFAEDDDGNDWWGEDYQYQTDHEGWFDWNGTDEGAFYDDAQYDYIDQEAGYGRDAGIIDDRYEDYYDAEDDFGFYEEDYDYQTDEGWYESWYGDADEDWDLF